MSATGRSILAAAGIGWIEVDVTTCLVEARGVVWLAGNAGPFCLAGHTMPSGADDTKRQDPSGFTSSQRPARRTPASRILRSNNLNNKGT
jgi:hypothetical protein